MRQRRDEEDEDSIKTTCNLWLHKDKIKSFEGKILKVTKVKFILRIKKTFRSLLYLSDAGVHRKSWTWLRSADAEKRACHVGVHENGKFNYGVKQKLFSFSTTRSEIFLSLSTISSSVIKKIKSKKTSAPAASTERRNSTKTFLCSSSMGGKLRLQSINAISSLESEAVFKHKTLFHLFCFSSVKVCAFSLFYKRNYTIRWINGKLFRTLNFTKWFTAEDTESERQWQTLHYIFILRRWKGMINGDRLSL